MSGSDERRTAGGARGAGQLTAGRYRSGERLGRGGTGTARRAHGHLPERAVAAGEPHGSTDGGESCPTHDPGDLAVSVAVAGRA